jgi:predicted house-cleaning noncanonical NTP pyrophosphatase (MazG superfamily)
LLRDILELIKNSDGCINIHQAEELEFFEFLFHSYTFKNMYETKKDQETKEKEEMNELIVEGITNLYRAIRG